MKKTEITTITTFISNDGIKFDSEADCRAYEQLCKTYCLHP